MKQKPQHRSAGHSIGLKSGSGSGSGYLFSPLRLLYFVAVHWHIVRGCGPAEEARLGAVGFCDGCGTCYLAGYDHETDTIDWFELGQPNFYAEDHE